MPSFCGERIERSAFLGTDLSLAHGTTQNPYPRRKRLPLSVSDPARDAKARPSVATRQAISLLAPRKVNHRNHLCEENLDLARRGTAASTDCAVRFWRGQLRVEADDRREGRSRATGNRGTESTEKTDESRKHEQTKTRKRGKESEDSLPLSSPCFVLSFLRVFMIQLSSLWFKPAFFTSA